MMEKVTQILPQRERGTVESVPADCANEHFGAANGKPTR